MRSMPKAKRSMTLESVAHHGSQTLSPEGQVTLSAGGAEMAAFLGMGGPLSVVRRHLYADAAAVPVALV